MPPSLFITLVTYSFEMIQEALTYMIVGSAVTLAVIKIVKKLKGKKKPTGKIDFKKESFKMEHKCDDCSAECVLRDASLHVIRSNQELCDNTRIESD